MTKKIYFCTNCRKQIEKVQSLLFVEESKRGFCSEKCIVDFFSPYMEHFDREELENRHILALESSEVGAHIFQDRKLFDQVLYSPDEVWMEKNDIHEEFYTHILRIDAVKNQFYLIICSYFEGEPSFVFFKTVTSSKALIDFYRKGNRMDNKLKETLDDSKQTDIELATGDSLEDITLPAEMVEDLELKKSEYLARFIEIRKDSDIPLEDFIKYDQFLPLTLDDPDEEYSSVDEHGDDLMIFIKSFQMEKLPFFYIICCVALEVSQVSEKVMIPVLSFPSVDADLYRHYAKGDKKNSKLKN